MGLTIEESKTIIPAMKSGAEPIEDWVQPELMKWLSLYQQQFQHLCTLHKRGRHYGSIPSNAIRDRNFYENVIFYRPDLQSDVEIGEWPARLTMEQIRDHLHELKGGITLIEFDNGEDAAACLSEDTFALYERWLGGYNNFVHYAAGELRTQRIPYIRLEYKSREYAILQHVELNYQLEAIAAKNDGAVLPLFPGCTSMHPLEKEHAAYGDSDPSTGWQEFLATKKAEAVESAPAFSGLL